MTIVESSGRFLLLALSCLGILAGCRGAGESMVQVRAASDPGEAVCQEPGHRAFTGIVARIDGGFAIKMDGELVPVWRISQMEAMAPHSPDLSDEVGEEVTVCGSFDGKAIYEAEVSSN